MLKTIVRNAIATIAALLASTIASIAHAQAPVEVSFYFPVAVGGPITKLIDA
jgi:sn-glycerol 3-phosphate transport system substrate-binding protein